MNLMQAACTNGQFCQQTHKPGLCKGQKRGQSEPAQAARDQTPVKNAVTAVTQLNATMQRLQQVLATERDPKRRASLQRSLARTRAQLAPHVQVINAERQARLRDQRIAIQDARQQDAIDKRKKTTKTTKKGSGKSTGLKPYQTATKL